MKDKERCTGYDPEIAEETFRRLKELGVTAPLDCAEIVPAKILPQEEQDEIRRIQKEHREANSRNKKRKRRH